MPAGIGEVERPTPDQGCPWHPNAEKCRYETIASTHEMIDSKLEGPTAGELRDTMKRNRSSHVYRTYHGGPAKLCCYMGIKDGLYDGRAFESIGKINVEES